jgi:hypothetical protein
MKTISPLAISFAVFAVDDVQAALRGADPSAAGAFFHSGDEEDNKDFFLTDTAAVPPARNLGLLDSSCTECETRSDCGGIASYWRCKEFPEVGKKYCLRKILGETLIPDGCTCKNFGDGANEECKSGRCTGRYDDEFGICEDQKTQGSVSSRQTARVAYV